MFKRLLINDRLYEAIVIMVSLIMGLRVLEATPVMYYADSYSYTLLAYGLKEGSYYRGFPIVGLPFILYLRFLAIPLWSIYNDLIYPVRIASLLIYVLASYMFFKVLVSLYQNRSPTMLTLTRVLATLLTLSIYASNPIRVLFSVVPYRDVFANLLTLIVLYMGINALNTRRLRYFIMFLTVFFFSIITRPELALLYSIPTVLVIFIILLHIYKPNIFVKYETRLRIIATVSLLTIAVFFGTFWLYEVLMHLYPELTVFGRYTFFERLYYFLSHNIFNHVLDSIAEKLGVLQLPLMKSSRHFIFSIIATMTIYSLLNLVKNNDLRYRFFYLLCISIPFMMLHFMVIYYGSLYARLMIPDRYFLHIQLFVELLLSYFIIEVSIIAFKVVLSKEIAKKILWLTIVSILVFNVVYSGYNNYINGIDKAIGVSTWMSSYDKVAKYIADEIILGTKGNVMIPMYEIFLLNILNNLVKTYGKDAIYLYPLIKEKLLTFETAYNFTGIISRADITKEEYCLLTYSLFTKIVKTHKISFIVIEKMGKKEAFLRENFNYVKYCLYPVKLYGNVNLYLVNRYCIENPGESLNDLLKCVEKYP